MKIVSFLLLLTIVASSGSAQMKHGRDKYDKANMMRHLPSITRSLGGSIQSFNGLNGRVANLPQYKQLKDYAGTLGLGWMTEMNRVVSAAGVTIGSSMSGHRDEKSSTIRYIGFNADIGYDVLKSEKISLYPLVGLGFQAYQAVFFKDNSAVNFDGVLMSPSVQNSITPVKFKNEFVVYRLGAGASFKAPKCPSTSIGLQAGYTGSFRKNDWKTNYGQALGNSPNDRISQFYFSLMLITKPWMRMGK
ncbi:MAG: hypothetical protein ABI415_00175 [Flavitalea sp.]